MLLLLKPGVQDVPPWAPASRMRRTALSSRFERSKAEKPSSRLPAFACRACGRASKRTVEYPALYFRCEPCAEADFRQEATPKATATEKQAI